MAAEKQNNNNNNGQDFHLSSDSGSVTGGIFGSPGGDAYAVIDGWKEGWNGEEVGKSL